MGIIGNREPGKGGWKHGSRQIGSSPAAGECTGLGAICVCAAVAVKMERPRLYQEYDRYE